MAMKSNTRPSFFYLVPGNTKKLIHYELQWHNLKRLLFWGKKPTPSGGIKILYQHCDLLNKNGYKAYPVHIGEFKIDWFPHETTPINQKDARRIMQENDILICPEIIPTAVMAFSCKRKIAFIQNWAHTKEAVGQDKNYEDYGFTDLMTCSYFVRDYMKNRSILPHTMVTNGIDINFFRNRSDDRIPGKVLYLNRKNVTDARKAISLLPPEIYRMAKFVELDNRYNQDEIVKYYQEADIFMATGYPEGFALPPLEAMACGCAVIGFTGGGGTDHMIDHETALTAPDADAEALARCLSEVLTNEALKEKIRRGGLEKAQEFGLERMERELIAFASTFN